MDASGGRLVAEVVGEVEVEKKVLILRRIRVRYRLRAPAEQRDVIEQVHGFHARFCPVYRSLIPAIEITTSLELIEDDST